MRRIILLSTLTLLLLSTSIIAQDLDLSNAYPAERQARVSNMMDPARATVGGYQITLIFEDNLAPQTLILWIDKVRFDKTCVGDLFIAKYTPDGKMTGVIGPITD